MIAPWMAYCLAASALLSLAALALEHGLRLRGLPLRWVWVGALLGSLSLAAVPWLRPAPAPATEASPRELPAARASSPAPDVARAPEPRLAGDAPARPAARAGIPAPSWERMHGPLLLLWALLSGCGILFLAGTHRALGRRRRTWRRVRVDGVRALLSKDTGPAVVGFLEGEIVLPDWVLTLSDPQRRLVLAHEAEHLRAGDSRLLAMALAALAVMPWNAPLWWQVRRLRDAIELDCDARVMARHPDVRTYGALLVEIGQRVSRQSFAFAAFAESTSFLERRVRAMFDRKPRGRRSLAGVSAALGMLLVLFACEVPLPTMAEPGAARHAETSTGGREAEIMIPPELMDESSPKPQEVAAALVRDRYPDVFAHGLPDDQAVWFALDRAGRIRTSWIGPGDAGVTDPGLAGCGAAASPCREAPLGSAQRVAAEAASKRFEEEQVRTHVPDMKIAWVLASGATLADGRRFAVRFAAERQGGLYDRSVIEWARGALRRDPIVVEGAQEHGAAALSPQERLVRERYPHLYARGLTEDRAVWVVADRTGRVRATWIGPAGFLSPDLARGAWPDDEEMRRLGAEHERREQAYLRERVPDLDGLEVSHHGSIIRNWRYHVRVNWATQRPTDGRTTPGGLGASMAPPFPDTLVLHLQDGVWKLRVRAPAEEDVPEPAPAVCSDPADDDMGEVIWPNCGGFKLYADGSILPSRVYPVVGRMIVGGPAWKAGLRSGDVLLTIDGIDARLVTSAFQVLRDPSVQSWEDPFRVRIRRGAEEHELVFPVHPSG